MGFIKSELRDLKIKVLLCPSYKDIHHIYPVPQPPYESDAFNSSSSLVEFVVMSNPQMLLLNDIRVAVFNSEIIKDMCGTLCAEGIDGKIDISLRGLLEQKSFYPLYPPSLDCPIE